MPQRPKDVDFETLKSVFDKPLTEASSRLDMSVTTLKKNCRKYGILQWPFRKISSLKTKLVEVNTRIEKCESEQKRRTLMDQKQRLANQLDQIYSNQGQLPESDEDDNGAGDDDDNNDDEDDDEDMTSESENDSSEEESKNQSAGNGKGDGIVVGRCNIDEPNLISITPRKKGYTLLEYEQNSSMNLPAMWNPKPLSLSLNNPRQVQRHSDDPMQCEYEEEETMKGKKGKEQMSMGKSKSENGVNTYYACNPTQKQEPIKELMNAFGQTMVRDQSLDRVHLRMNPSTSCSSSVSTMTTPRKLPTSVLGTVSAPFPISLPKPPCTTPTPTLAATTTANIPQYKANLHQVQNQTVNHSVGCTPDGRFSLPPLCNSVGMYHHYHHHYYNNNNNSTFELNTNSPTHQHYNPQEQQRPALLESFGAPGNVPCHMNSEQRLPPLRSLFPEFRWQ